jgi:hypothetical protein
MANNTTYNANSLVANSASIQDLKLNSETLTVTPGTASTTIPVTLLDGSVASGILTISLPDGQYNGQLKVFITTSAHAHEINPDDTNSTAGAFVRVTMTAAVGCTVTMMWVNSSKWVILSRSSGAAQTEAAVAGLAVLT